MTIKKDDYPKIAAILKSRYDLHIGRAEDKINGLIEVAEDLAEYFKQDNEEFNRDIFLKDCGVYGDKPKETPHELIENLSL